jgi:ATP-dependent Lhr-like helicase
MEDPVYHRLAPFLREFIYREAWPGLRPVQTEALRVILDGNEDVLITSGTASGKTEAAFLPILNLIQADPFGSVRVCYISPLRALINDQFRRLEPLCEAGNIPVHRWHSDVEQSHKRDLMKNPGGILQITPESLESLLINKTEALNRIFGGLQFIVIDEVHSFIESDRGIQLRSQLNRLLAYTTPNRARRIGLSATVGDVGVAQAWLNSERPDSVHVIDPSGVSVSTRFHHMHFVNTKTEIPPDLIHDLYQLTRNRKALIFCNSRENVEQVTVQLNRLCARDRLPELYLPHHGSISKEIREEAERRMKDDTQPCSTICTNTLELGIDIGQLDLIVQIDSTHSVMSFVQRLGRSGRRSGEPRTLQVYTSEMQPVPGSEFYELFPFGMLKALAVTNLFLENWIEPPSLPRLPFHIVYHQLLSLITERNGLLPSEIVDHFVQSRLFPEIQPSDYSALIKHLLSIDHLERMPEGELILGLDGERIVRSRDFYAVFFTPPDWEVRTDARVLGKISPSPDLSPGICILLGGHVWEVMEIIEDRKQVIVIPAVDAHDVMFSATGIPEMHPRIACRVMEILQRDDIPAYLSPDGQDALSSSRRLFSQLNMNGRRIFETDENWILFPWTGSRAARTIQFALKKEGLDARFPSTFSPWVISIPRTVDLPDLLSKISAIAQRSSPAKEIVDSIPSLFLMEHKYDEFLPVSLLRARAVFDLVDWEEASKSLRQLSQHSIA